MNRCQDCEKIHKKLYKVKLYSGTFNFCLNCKKRYIKMIEIINK